MAIVEILLEKGIATFDRRIIGKEMGGVLVPTLYPFKEHEEVIAVGQNYTLTARIRRAATMEGAISFLIPMHLTGLTFNKNLSEKNPYFGEILVTLYESAYFYHEGGKIEELGKYYARLLGYKIEKERGFYLIRKKNKTVATVPEKKIKEYVEDAKMLMELLKNKDKEREKIREINVILEKERQKMKETKADLEKLDEDIKKIAVAGDSLKEKLKQKTRAEQKSKKGIFKKFLK